MQRVLSTNQRPFHLRLDSFRPATASITELLGLLKEVLAFSSPISGRQDLS